MHCSEAFSVLKPFCDRIIKDPNKEDLQGLSCVFGKVPGKTLCKLQDYILYPLQLNLQRPDVRLEIKKCLLDCIKNLVHYTGVKEVKKFFHLFTLTFIQLFDKNSNDMVADVSEELKLSVVECAKEVVLKSDDNIVEEIYEKKNIPKISQGIFICMQIMQNEKMRTLRIAAVEFIMAICRVDNLVREFDISRPMIADTIMFIVPGMLSGLHKVSVGDEKQGHLLTMMALRAWSRILVLVVEDVTVRDYIDYNIHFSAKVTERLEKIKVKNASNECKESDSKKLLETIHSQHRSAEWVENVSENVIKMIESLQTLQHHSHWKVRLELVNTCHSILCNCHQQFKKGSIVLLEIILSLCDDDTNEVALTSETCLKNISDILQEDSGIYLYELLDENFFNLVTKLPRIIHVESESNKLSALSLLKQYILLLGCERLPQLMQTSSHLQRTVHALLQTAELQSSSLSLLEDCSLRDLTLNQDASFQTPWIQFKHFADRSIKEKLEELLRLLGQNGDLEILCNHFLDLLGSEPVQRNEIAFALNEVMLGGAGKDEYGRLVRNMLDVYLSTGMWYVPLTVTPSSSLTSHEGNVNASQARSNLQFSCLLVDGIGKVATALGSHFCEFLMRCLYPVVERAGSPHEALTAAGLKAAASIAKAVNQGNDITSLLASNMDYFMVQVSLRLRGLRNDHSVLSVLAVAMQHSNKEMLPHLQNALSDVLLQSCDNYQMHHTSLFLHVFYIFFRCIKKWFPSKIKKKKDFSIHSSVTMCTSLSFLEYVQNSKIARNENSESFENLSEDSEKVSESKFDDSNQLENLDEDKEPEIPSHVKMSVSIVQRCIHLLPGKDKQCRLQALEALTEGLEVLADFEDQLLPIIHQVWSPLVGRLQDGNDPLLLNRSFSLLCTLAHLAQDFIRARTLKQVWSPLCKFLSGAAVKSKNKDSGSAFRYTQLFKLQLRLLEGLGGLVTHLQLQEKEIYDLLCAAVPYLSCYQPKPLQENCVKLFQTIAYYDGDVVWLEMMKIKNQNNMQVKEHKEYVKNVELILKFLTNHT